MKASLKISWNMAGASKFFPIKMSTKETTWMELQAEREYTNGLMEPYMRESFTMDIDMERAT